MEHTQMRKTLNNPIAPLFGLSLQSWLQKLKDFQLTWEDFQDYETNSFFLHLFLSVTYFFPVVPDNLPLTWWSFGFFLQVVFKFIFIFPHSVYYILANKVFPLHFCCLYTFSWECSFISKLVQSTGHTS